MQRNAEHQVPTLDSRVCGSVPAVGPGKLVEDAASVE